MKDRRSARGQSRRLNLECLEGRVVLASPSAAWIGQVGDDFVGPWVDPRPSTIQDIRVRLEGLPADRAVTRAVVQGFGADRWEFGGAATGWFARLDRSAGSTTADLFFEPARQEVGRQFSVGLTYDDGTFREVYFAGGFADPNLKMPGQGVSAQWLGAIAGVDLTRPSASVGPDGETDLQIRIDRIDLQKSLEAIELVDATGEWIASWGNNPSRVGTMEFTPVAGVPGAGVLTFSKPNRAMTGPLTIQLKYRGGGRDSTTVALGTTSTANVELPASITFREHMATARWLGQVVTDPQRPGWVRVEIRDMPTRALSAWQIDDTFSQTWLWTITGQGSPWAIVPDSKRLIATQDTAGTWFLEFDARWDQSGRPLSIMAASDTGQFYRFEITGGGVEVTLRSAMPAASEIVATPGMNLQALLDNYGTVRLSDGLYRLTEPLVLRRPVRLIGSAGAVLQFAQPANSAGWSTVIKLAAGNTTLSGFQVRFEGPVKWLPDIRYGPAVIGSPDNYDNLLGRTGPMAGIVIENLDIVSPAANYVNEESARVIRLIDDVSGRVEGNRFFGSQVELTGGPWRVAANRINGTPLGSFSYDAFAFHHVRGMELIGNQVRRGADSGPIMRFLVINGDSRDILVAGNEVVGLGARFGDDPWIQELNAHEVILSEAYHVSFEGSLRGVDASRRIVRIPLTLGRPYRPGDTLAVLTGSDAGTYRTVLSVIDGTTLLLDAPLPQWVGAGTVVSINRGIPNLTIRENLVDQTGSPQSRALVLVGNLYGTKVTGNRIVGGFRGFQITAYPSETPRDWGWTRNVIFGLEFAGNEMTDVLWFNQIGVSHNPFARANYGHLYLAGVVSENVFRWSERFLVDSIWQEPGQADRVLPGLELGEGGTWDDTEYRVTLGTNFIDLPAGWANRPAVWIRSGRVNGKAAGGEVVLLTPVQRLQAPAGLRLVHDSGVSATDGLTNDPRLALEAVAGLTYRYRLPGDPQWRTIADPANFVPAGLADGPVSVEVSALDSLGQAGPSAVFVFVLDTVAPAAPTGAARLGSTGIVWSPSSASDVVVQELRFRNEVYDESRSVGATVSSATFDRWVIGTNRLEIVAVDQAGNRSATIRADFVQAPSGTWGGQDGSDFASLSPVLRSDGRQDVRLDVTGLPYGQSVVSVTVAPFGGGVWAWPVTQAGQYAAAWVPAAGALSGRIYFQTDRREVGRPFFVTLRFADGTAHGFWVNGGTADPNLPASRGGNSNTGRMSGASASASSGSIGAGGASESAGAVRLAPVARLRARWAEVVAARASRLAARLVRVPMPITNSPATAVRSTRNSK